MWFLSVIAAFHQAGETGFLKQEVEVGLPSPVVVAAQERASADLAQRIKPSGQAAAFVEALPDLGLALRGKRLGLGEAKLRGDVVVGVECQGFFG